MSSNDHRMIHVTGEEPLDFEADAAPAVADDDALKRLASLSQALLLAQFEAAALDTKLSQQEAIIRRISEEDIPQLLKECGLSEVKLEDGTKVTVVPELDCSISEERSAKAMAWLRAHDLDGVIKTVVVAQFGRGEEQAARVIYEMLLEQQADAALKETVHPQTLKATLKEELEAGRPVPADIFALRPFDKTKLTLPDGAAKPARIRKRR